MKDDRGTLAAVGASRDARAMPIELVHLADASFELAPAILIPNGPRGTRGIVEVTAATVEGERFQASLAGRAAADWAYMSADGIVSLDVRITLETHDGALVFTEYGGRLDTSAGFGTSPVYVAPRYETGDERYAWMNRIQAIGKGEMATDMTRLTYEIYEVR